MPFLDYVLSCLLVKESHSCSVKNKKLINKCPVIKMLRSELNMQMMYIKYIRKPPQTITHRG